MLQHNLDELHIPLFTFSHKPRRTLPTKILTLFESWGAKLVYSNIEYEVDELRRDIEVCDLAKSRGIQCIFLHDKLIVEPNTLKTQAGKAYTVRLIAN